MTRLAHRVWALVAVATIAIVTAAHVGSNTVFFDGMAGPYAVRVIIRPPDVIPGLADISVRVRNGAATGVTVQPFQWNAGVEGAPRPDDAVRVPGDSMLFSAQLWLMTATAYSVHVVVDGAEGSGTAIVPLNAVRTAVLDMPPFLGLALTGLGIFLFVGAVTIVGAAVRESVIDPSDRVSVDRRRAAGMVMAGSVVVLGAAVWGGKAWWDGVDRDIKSGIFAAFEVTTSTSVIQGERVLALEIENEAWRGRQWTPLVPDHGKLMHMFLVKDEFGAFAHVHPVAADSNVFEVPLPGGLPEGQYRVYADIVHESGFSQTLVDTTTVPPPPEDRVPAAADPDDSWMAGAPPAGGRTGATADTLDDGAIVVWNRPEQLSAGRELTLTFEVWRPDGGPVTLEPYMGMPSHAALSRNDGAVFVHLHPTGSISMGAQRTFAMRSESDTVLGALGRRMTEAGPEPMRAFAPTNRVEFPFEFPRPGLYRLWVQFKYGGQIMTGVFDAELDG